MGLAMTFVETGHGLPAEAGTAKVGDAEFVFGI
jgi:hypothetical protein